MKKFMRLRPLSIAAPPSCFISALNYAALGAMAESPVACGLYNLENGSLPFDVTMTRIPHGSRTTP